MGSTASHRLLRGSIVVVVAQTLPLHERCVFSMSIQVVVPKVDHIGAENAASVAQCGNAVQDVTDALAGATEGMQPLFRMLCVWCVRCVVSGCFVVCVYVCFFVVLSVRFFFVCGGGVWFVVVLLAGVVWLLNMGASLCAVYDGIFPTVLYLGILSVGVCSSIL